MYQEYTNPLSMTSQFSFCGLPFRLDTYSGCGFNCSYCFARLRGGNTATKKLKVANPQKIINKFKRAILEPDIATSSISQAIRHQMPLHFGGMSDPFQPAEAKLGVSLEILRFLASVGYPTIISTKSTLLSSEPYLTILKNHPQLLIQFSFSSTVDKISSISEPSAPKPSSILKSIDLISKAGINTSIRWQPYIPKISEAPDDFVSIVSGTGAKHLSLEHLKLPLEKNSELWSKLSKRLDFDIRTLYKENYAKPDGRELVLPASYKIEKVKEVKSKTNKSGMTFGAADNEIQYLSDTYCCCSGADQFEGFKNWNKFQIAYAVKKSYGKEITYDLIADEWKPKGAIDEHLNSNSRLPKKYEGHNTVEDYLTHRWQNLVSPFNPTFFYGVSFSGKTDKNGKNIYCWEDESCWRT